MWPFCKKNSLALTADIETDANKYSNWVIQSVGSKADKNKRNARNVSMISVALSLLVLFVLNFEDNSLPKYIASIFTIMNSLLLAWIQLEKPYERWRIYRKYHRIFQAERVKFLNKLSPYNSSDADSKLFKVLSDLQLQLHNDWEGLVPASEQVKTLQAGG
jgi:hypothetical protein